MKIIFADDMPEMRSAMLRSLKEIERDFGPFEILEPARDGNELIQLVEKNPDVDLVLTDLRMPNLDGLSALVYLIANKKCNKIVMVSSENIATVNKVERAALDIEIEEKMTLLDKIAHRVIDEEKVKGKINSILTGCEKLSLDPISIAEYYGATGYMRKPISGRKLSHLFDNLSTNKHFISIGLI